MNKYLLTILLITLLPYFSAAQTNRKRTHQKNVKVKETTVAPEDQKPVNTFKNPRWAPAGYKSQYHVYFPDYETFYDPGRGYVTRDKDSWIASPSMPLFLNNADLKTTRIQILEDIGLDSRPELSYPRYMKMYPADPSKKPILTPVPKNAGQSGAH